MRFWAAAVAIGLVLAGCAKKDEVTISTPEGNVTVTGDGKGGNVSIEGPEGKIEIDGKDDAGVTVTNEKGEKVTVGAASSADFSKYGIDLYPDAKPQAGESGMGKVEGPQGTMETVVMTTADPTEKVLAFFKAQLKDAKEVNYPEGGMVNGKSKAGHDVTAMASRAQGKSETTLTVSVVSKK